MKRNITITGLFAAVLLAFAACQEPIILEGPNDPVEDGYVRISFTAQVPDMSEVQTKVVDPDGEDISNMTLFCFDSRGLFISTVSATLTPDSGTPSLSGTFDAVIPEMTERIHFVANQNMSIFSESSFLAKSETEVLSAMEGSSGIMIYWARYVKTGDAPIAEQIKNAGTISLVRNHAKISINDNGAHGSAITGFAAVNTNAFGTVAPYCDTHEWEAPSYSAKRIFVTIPHNESKLSDINDTRTIASEPEQYVFESENSSDDPVSVILRDANAKYYRVMLMDADGEFIPIMRNHSYVVNIAGPLSYGQDSFEAALEAPATNNIWLSISDDIKTVIGNGYQLSVEQTHIVVCEPSSSTLDVKYSLTNADGSAPAAGVAPTVSWLDGNTVALHTFSNTFVSGEGTVSLSLNTLASDEFMREGTLLIKYGTLQRKVKITSIPKQSFTPAWITTNVYGKEAGEKITMMFHIPETFPAELFPLDVMVTVNDLDVRSESGMVLPVIREDDPRYGEDVLVNGKPVGYKYVLTAEEPGTQRLYLKTILSHDAETSVDVTIESEYFETLTKTATFHTGVDKYILLTNLHSYKAADLADDVIYYYLVPQKKGAVVNFPAYLAQDVVFGPDHLVQSFTSLEPNDYDEFLIYSQYLDHDETAADLDFTFHPIEESLWSTGGRVYGFTRNPEATGIEAGAELHMITNSSRSNEVVRIASNPAGQPSVKGSGATSQSVAYRSAVFELSTFHPFHFAATFNDVGTHIIGKNEEVEDNVLIPYGKDRDAVIEFDVTSFMSSMVGMSDSEQISVDPFGREFEIYIDAPMLELGDNPGLSGKIKAHSTIPGRFVYTVDASRDTERGFGSATAEIKDNSTHTYLDRENAVSINQSGERKTINFKTKDIVSAGEIVISSQEEEVVYYKKTFKLNNQSITGSIRFGTDASSAVAVPARSFVPMERTYDNTRIGSMTITSDGTYELRLRAEYSFDWNTDEIMFEYTANGVHYSVTVDSLADLVASSDLVLVPTAGH